MLIYRIVLVFISTSIFISGCSSSSSLVKSSFLKTHIQENDAKIFTLYLTPVHDRALHGSSDADGGQKDKPSKGKGKGKGDKKGQGSTSNKQQNQGNGTNISSAYQEEISEALLDTLDETLREKGYCREGYIELSRTIGKRLVKIKGECHESATQVDKTMFPNDS